MDYTNCHIPVRNRYNKDKFPCSDKLNEQRCYDEIIRWWNVPYVDELAYEETGEIGVCVLDGATWHDMMEVIANESRHAYRKLVYETPGFYDYFRKATPIDLIERMRIGSRPASRRSQSGIDDLRAIPWVFAWSQSRCMLPGWYGFGTGIAKAAEQFEDAAFREMFAEWYFMRTLTADAEMVLAKADLGISKIYSELAGDLHAEFFPIIENEYDLTRDLILEYSEHDALLEGDITLQRAIMLRNPYVDPMSLMQVDLLARWRASGYNDTKLFDALQSSVNGIAQGLQNTG